MLLLCAYGFPVPNHTHDFSASPKQRKDSLCSIKSQSFRVPGPNSNMGHGSPHITKQFSDTS